MVNETGMIERVARYICRVSFVDHESPDREGPDIQSHVDDMWREWKEEARQLLAVMRQPTNVMELVGAGEGHWHDLAYQGAEQIEGAAADPRRRQEAGDVWQAMIGAALAEEE